jgi:hypothetical protein
MTKGSEPTPRNPPALRARASAFGPRSFPYAFHCVAPMEGTGVKLF